MSVLLETMFNEIQQQGLNSATTVNLTGSVTMTGTEVHSGTESHSGTVTNSGTVVNNGAVVSSKTLTTFTGPTASPTPAQLAQGIVAYNVGGLGSLNMLMPTGSALGSALSTVTGTSFKATVSNTGTGGTVNLTSSTGTTVVGSTAIGNTRNAELTFYQSAANVWSVYSVISV